MKKVILSCLFISMSFFAYTQDTICVEGYYIQRFLKSEIIFKIQNQVLKEKNKSFKVMIDYKSQSFFFPLQVNTNISLWTRKSIGNILQLNHDYKNMEVFYFPPFNEYLKGYFDDSVISINHVELPSQCNYYVNGNDTIHVYKLYYIEGHALRIKVDNDYLDRQRNIDLAVKWNLDPTLIDKNIPLFYAYLFYKCDVIKCDISPEGFIEWNHQFKEFEDRYP